MPAIWRTAAAARGYQALDELTQILRLGAVYDFQR